MALFAPSESPAIVVKEVDLTGGVPNVQTTTGAYVGQFGWGPVEEATLVANEAGLVSTFSAPTTDSASIDFLSASYFLRYSNSLQLVRKIKTSSNGNAAATVTLAGDGSVQSINLTSGGGDYTGAPTVTLSGGTLVDGADSADEDLTLTATVAGGVVTGVAVDSNGDATYPLRYSSDTGLKVVFTGGRDVALNATDIADLADQPVVKNEDNFLQQASSLNTAGNVFIAKYPGTLGNSLKVKTCPYSTSDTSFDGDTDFVDNFDGAPGTSSFASQVGASNDEIHVLVIDEDGLFTGTRGTVLERFPFLSLAKNAKTGEGLSNFVKDVINSASNYIWMAGFGTSIFDAAAGTDAANGVNYHDGSYEDVRTVSFVNGANGAKVSTADIVNGYSAFNDKDTISVDFLIAPGMADRAAQDTVVEELVTIAGTTRKDCIAVTSPARSDIINNSDAVNDTITTAQGFPSSSYLVVDNNYLKVYDKYNDKYIYIPAASSTAGIMAASDLNTAPWFSPAGPRRGQYFGVTALAYSPTKSQRDQLYRNGVNPIANLPGQGVLLFGDKTRLTRPSAFDRINVRRLFLVLERAIALAARNSMFEFNDEFTRAEFVNIIEPFLREVKGRRGITDFRVVCDETNNTPAVIDRNEFIANIFIKPARSINYITLNFVAVRTGVDFEEVAGLSV